MRLADRQREFAAALTDPASDVPVGLLGPDRMPSRKRYAIYRNNVVHGLIEALRAAFPATCRIVGEEFFRAMARDYVLREPPASPLLFNYGAGFPDFIVRFESAAALPYLADVARIERAGTEAYHAAEQPALDADAFAEIPNHRIPELCLILHPSLRVVRSHLPSLTIWRMNVGDGVPSPVDLDAGGEDVLVVRPKTDVDVHLLSPGGASFLSSLASGETLISATNSAISESSSFELTSTLAALIAAGVFVGFRFAELGAR
ncbi:DNA-binding domain-containing protein [Bradyrhizobium lablabi]|uniref:HvfC/BufC N-terminal domain-containing protein n=1 Tax=Bradyrhizobium lablabi TaxID=722472 RepID=UPI002896CC42|nr:DNA-binding domain-containing protein [Bradyrhizobium lablabi]